MLFDLRHGSENGPFAQSQLWATCPGPVCRGLAKTLLRVRGWGGGADVQLRPEGSLQPVTTLGSGPFFWTVLGTQKVQTGGSTD